MDIILQEKRFLWSIDIEDENEDLPCPQKIYESPSFWVFQHKWKLILKITTKSMISPQHDYEFEIKYLGEEDVERSVELQITTFHNRTSSRRNSESQAEERNFEYLPFLAESVSFDKKYNSKEVRFFDDFSESIDFGRVTKVQVLCKMKDSKPTPVSDHNFISTLKQQDILISNEYEELFESGKFSDVTFIVDGKNLPLHKNILSTRSTYFARMFDHNVKENDANVVRIEDFPHEVMKEFFRFVYAARVENIEEHISELLKASDKYGMKGLKSLCEQTIAKAIQNENALECLYLADLCNAKWLKNKCIQYMVSNAKEIVKLPEFSINSIPDDLRNEFVIALADGMSVS